MIKPDTPTAANFIAAIIAEDIKANKNDGRIMTRFPEAGVLIVFLVFGCVFSFSSDKFLTIDSISSMFTVAAEVGIVAVGGSILMISGEFDISVGSIMCFSTLIFCWLVNTSPNRSHDGVIRGTIVKIASAIPHVNAAVLR